MAQSDGKLVMLAMAVKRHKDKKDLISPPSPKTKKKGLLLQPPASPLLPSWRQRLIPNIGRTPPAPLNAGPRLPSTHFHPAGRVFGVKIRGRNWAQERSNGEPPLFSASWQSSPAGGTGRICFTMGREAAKKTTDILGSVSSGIEQFLEGLCSLSSQMRPCAIVAGPGQGPRDPGPIVALACQPPRTTCSKPKNSGVGIGAGRQGDAAVTGQFPCVRVLPLDRLPLSLPLKSPSRRP